MTLEQREEKYRLMRERQRKLREAVRKPVASPPRPPLADCQMLRVNDVAKQLKMSRQTVIRWFRSRSVVVPHRNRETILIPRQVLNEWIEKHYLAARLG